MEEYYREYLQIKYENMPSSHIQTKGSICKDPSVLEVLMRRNHYLYEK